MAATVARAEDGTLTLSISIPWKDVEAEKEKIVDAFVKTSQAPGFRKGKAPRHIVEKDLDQAKLKEEVLKELLPKYYMQALEEHKIKPIINPKVHVEKLEDGQDWNFHALTCELPKVELGKYKEEVQKITAKSKIEIPGKEKQEPSFDEIMDTVIKNVKVETPQVLVEQEVDRLLSQTLEDIKRLGLTLDQYLGSTGKDPAKLREEYAEKAKRDIALEFTLQKIAEEEKITVEDKEIDEAIAQAKDEAERTNLEQNRYLLASIIRQQKTLDFLKNL